MKGIIILSAFSFLSALAIAQNDPANQLASKIAQKMKDSLNLTALQKIAIQNTNMDLYLLKKTVRLQHPGSDSLRIFLQRIENKRDTLYSAILSQQEYLLFKQKKRNLVNNN